MPRASAQRPSRAQVRVAEAVTRWYLERYFGTRDDPGTPRFLSDRAHAGALGVDEEALRRGDEAALFKLLVVTAMFQRRQDQQILRILRGLTEKDAAEVSTAAQLLALVDASECEHIKTNDDLLSSCDLTKDADGRGVCRASPTTPCHMKRHSEVLKRYGHFGKVPTSIALVVREGGGSLSAVRERAISQARTRRARAERLTKELSKAWRVSDKIAAMFLSAVCNPDLFPAAPWADGIDWTYFVVIDSNVDLFLGSINYDGPGTYAARRDFISSLAQDIDLRTLTSARVHAFNPRLLQQAMYVFMSQTNRRVIERDCSHLGERHCRACPSALRTRCALRLS